jgi:diguanylate cyclase (GGDEF)-like protein
MPEQARPLLARRLRGLDRALPIAVKLALPLAAVIGVTAVAYLSVALPLIRTELERAYTGQARAVATIVQAEYALHGSDRAELDLFVRGVVDADPSIARIRIYRVASGAPVLWASSRPAERASYTPTPEDLAPLTTGATIQAVEELDGVRLLETVQPLRSGGAIDASVGVYTALDALEAAATGMTRVVVLTAAFAGSGVMLAAAAVLYALVLRPIRRLQHAAVRIAAGDLTVRLHAGDEPPGRDEIVSVAQAFDRMAGMVAEQRAAVERLALTDGLTGLPNRRSFDRGLEVEVRRAARLRYPLAVLLVDLDGFKRLNDTQGHRAGDDALVRTAAALRAAARDTDLVARYGGDEFAVIQPGSEPAAALVVGTRIRAAVEGLAIVADPPSGRPLRASVGVAALQAGQDPDAVVAAADAALYRAKARGGGVEVAAGLPPA